MAFCLSHCHDELNGLTTNEFAFLLLSLSFASVGHWYVMSSQPVEGTYSANSSLTHDCKFNNNGETLFLNSSVADLL